MKKLFLLFSMLVLASCAKKDDPKPAGDGKLFTFIELKADYSTINQGDVTNITANFTGDATIKWSASAGGLFGSGKVVLFGASSCCKGNHDVTCTIVDKNNNSESKTISIDVQ